jgi:hypothetical protein
MQTTPAMDALNCLDVKWQSDQTWWVTLSFQLHSWTSQRGTNRKHWPWRRVAASKPRLNQGRHLVLVSPQCTNEMSWQAQPTDIHDIYRNILFLHDASTLHFSRFILFFCPQWCLVCWESFGNEKSKHPKSKRSESRKTLSVHHWPRLRRLRMPGYAKKTTNKKPSEKSTTSVHVLWLLHQPVTLLLESAGSLARSNWNYRLLKVVSFSSRYLLSLRLELGKSRGHQAVTAKGWPAPLLSCGMGKDQPAENHMHKMD